MPETPSAPIALTNRQGFEGLGTPYVVRLFSQLLFKCARKQRFPLYSARNP